MRLGDRLVQLSIWCLANVLNFSDFLFLHHFTFSLFSLRIIWKRLKKVMSWIQNVTISFGYATVSSLKHYDSNYAYVVICDLNVRDQSQFIVY